MFKCDCGKVFENQRGLNAHQVTHKDRQKRYLVSRARNKKERVADSVHQCLYCLGTFRHGFTKENKFCNTECYQKYRWEHVYKPNILLGKGGNLRRFLIEEFGEVCQSCGIGPQWNNKILTLQVDHKDGDSDNNAVDNIRLLCPNCHTQTETYGHKGRKRGVCKNSKRNRYLREFKATK